MKILFVCHTPLFPVDSGVVRRNAHILREATRGHEVSVLVLGSGHDEAGFRQNIGQYCRTTLKVDVHNIGWRRVLRVCLYIITGRPWVRHWHRAKVQGAIDKLCKDSSPDIVHLTTPLLRLYRYPSTARIVADAHNVEYDNLRRVAQQARSPLRKLLFFAFAWRLRTEEMRTTQSVDLLLTVSERDRGLFRALAPHTRSAVVANGVDLQEFSPTPRQRHARSLVFVGMMNYHPNDAGIQYFLRHTFPLIRKEIPDVRLTIVGGNPSQTVRASASAQVRVTGLVPDVRPFMDEAEVLIVPLYAGGGTRLKLLEAMAVGIPAVSTTIGCEGLAVRDGEHLLIADTAEAFARAVVRLLIDQPLRESLALRATQLVYSSYGWEKIGETLRSLYGSVAEGHPIARPLAEITPSIVYGEVHP